MATPSLITTKIDPAREYTAKEVAILFGVDPAQPGRWAERSLNGVRSPMIGRFPIVSRKPWRVLGSTLIAFASWRETNVKPHQGVLVTAKSENAKLGRVAATYVARQSCPKSCPFVSAGCYAEHDNTRTNWDRITAGSVGVSPLELAKREAAMIDELKGDRDLRLHVAGDSTTEEGTVAIAEACSRYVERGRELGHVVKVWAYTHAWRLVSRRAWGTVSVLASCESACDVRDAHARGYAAALVVEEFKDEATHLVGGDVAVGVKIIPCPQQTRGKVCTDCRLCFDEARLRKAKLTIGFALHGWGSNKAKRALDAATKRTRTPLPMAA